MNPHKLIREFVYHDNDQHLTKEADLARHLAQYDEIKSISASIYSMIKTKQMVKIKFSSTTNYKLTQYGRRRYQLDRTG